jgi:hypothetical protein
MIYKDFLLMVSEFVARGFHSFLNTQLPENQLSYLINKFCYYKLQFIFNYLIHLMKTYAMCHIIDSEVILVNILKKKEECTFSELINYKSELEKRFPNIYVDVTRRSVLSSIFSLPQVFNWNENVIKKADHSEEFYTDKFVEYFNSKIGDIDIRTKFKAILNEFI